MKRARLAACLFVPAIVAACSSFAGTNPADVQEGDAGSDAGDAGVDRVVTGTAPDASVPNLLKDGTFESSCMALTGDHLSVTWEGDHTHNHSTGACRVCFLGDNSPSGTVTVAGDFAAGPDRPLSAAVFVLAASPTPALQANISTNVLLPEGIGGGGSGATTNLTASDWTQLSLPTSFQSQDAHGATVTIDVYSADPVDAGAGTACIYVDDASLFFATK